MSVVLIMELYLTTYLVQDPLNDALGDTEVRSRKTAVQAADTLIADNV